jgi:dihydropyrimidinase
VRIFGGQVVTPDGVQHTDLALPGADPDVDARGCIVLPGGVDPHTHPLAALHEAGADALAGGTTTLVAFTVPQPGETPAAAYVRAQQSLSQTDARVELHPAIWEPDRLTRDRLVELQRAGARAVKLYLAFSELGMRTSDRTLYETLRDGAQLGLLVRAHCENDDAVQALTDEVLSAGRTGVDGFVASRPPLVEEEAVARTLALARLAGAPVYLVHLTTADSLELVRDARRRGQIVWAEACTHHLLLDDGCYEGADAERYLVVPPLRSRADVEALWEGVADGTLDAIGSDHATAPYRPPFAGDDFRSLAYGFGGVGLRVPLVLSEGARRGVSLERLAALLADGPARACGLAGSRDGDVVVWDPDAEWTAERAPFDGVRVQGRVRDVFVRGVRVD